MVAPLQLKIALAGDLRGFADQAAAGIRRGAMRAAERMRARAKLAFRQETRAVLGDRAANTWRDEVYPKGGKQSWHPTTLIFSKWPGPIRAHTEGATIAHRDGLMLAIPTDNVPRRGQKPMSPAEVERSFGQDLYFVKRPNATLAFIKAIASKSKRGWRKATPGRLAQGRKQKLVLMFVLVKQVTLRKRLDWPRLADELAPEFNRYVAEEIARELNA